MKRVPLYLFLTLLTFVVGISFTAFWMLKTEIPEVPIPKSQKLRDENFIHDSRFSKEQKKFWEKELLPRFRELPLEALSDSVMKPIEWFYCLHLMLQLQFVFGVREINIF